MDERRFHPDIREKLSMKGKSKMVNNVTLMGRLTKDPETRYTTDGKAIARFTLAVERRFVKQGEQRQADFINIVAFRQTAEFVGKYFVKGQLAAVVGSIQTRSWDGEDGQKRYATEVIANEVHFCGDKRDSEKQKSKPQEDDFIPVEDDSGLPF